MLKFFEIFESSKEQFRKVPILKEFEWFEWFVWFGPSPIEPFNSGPEPLRRALRGPQPVEGAAERSAHDALLRPDAPRRSCR